MFSFFALVARPRLHSRACASVTNFTSAHESRVGRFMEERVRYPENQIEIDNRLAWFLSNLQELLVACVKPERPLRLRLVP